MSIKYIGLSMGYVESSQMGHVIFRNQTGEDLGKIEAVKDLAKALFEHYLEEIRYKEKPFLFRECCKKTAEDTTAHFCKKCGTDLRPVEMDFGAYEEYLRSLPTLTADESGEELDGWWQWVSLHEVIRDCKEEGDLLEISENGEIHLIQILDPALMTDDIREAWEAWHESSGYKVKDSLDDLKRDIE